MKFYESVIKVVLFTAASFVVLWFMTMPIRLMGNVEQKTDQTQTEQEDDYEPSEFSGFSLGPNGIVPGLGGMPIMD